MNSINKYRLGKSRGSRGISLLEVLISMVILGFGLLGLAPMVVLSVEGNTISRDFSVAAQLAKEKIEEYESFETITGLGVVETENDIQDRYTRVVCVSDNTLDASIPVGLLKVEVLISWTDNSKVARSTKYSTLM